MASELDESLQPSESPDAYVRRLAEGKAQAVLACLDSVDKTGKLIVAADTAVVDCVISEKSKKRGGYEILGKPIDEQDAEVMLRRLRARQHMVYTALAVLRAEDGIKRSEVIISEVPMRNYTDEEMMAYITSGDPLDKAGAYAIQHSGFNPVIDFKGCYANVMGLPICHLTRMLSWFDVCTEVSIPQACQQMLNYSCPIFQQVMDREGQFIG